MIPLVLAELEKGGQLVVMDWNNRIYLIVMFPWEMAVAQGRDGTDL